MSRMTITEALAELKTLRKRIEKKRDSLPPYLARQDRVKDPLEQEGGSVAFVARERQAIGDLCERIVRIRTAIQASNLVERATVVGVERSVAEWLAWRRDVEGLLRSVMDGLTTALSNLRSEARQKNLAIKQDGEANAPSDIVVAFKETELIKEREQHEATLGTLDGLLSLKNATTFIEFPD